MKIRTPKKEELFESVVTRDALLSDEAFTVDGFEGHQAISDRVCYEEFFEFIVEISWIEGDARHCVTLVVAGRTIGNLVLASLGNKLSLQALIALGFTRGSPKPLTSR